jgi:hypothetical protein
MRPFPRFVIAGELAVWDVEIRVIPRAANTFAVSYSPGNIETAWLA